ncbi:hypothetical protein [Ignicoccus hospitalis]|uniref:Uncharacterized protein n=1 Tax=Ignicoccus hospitalis (strain KIN4/I / DSM 18386 / JCM 14125) TaxID=453591 RepID=A8A9T3_IGNH4|nr:hypothetical protein [Ignicoccus hospitalis]ABU81685.1 hypothetical protein Igni_0502 [Ignicoccus hospitalis KIN4/I]HIH89802.1 hypothetical protein [Desulfurococcaceae archaeon]
MSFFFSFIKKEIEATIKEAVLPLGELEKIYSFKDAQDLDSKALAIAKALGVDDEEDLINAIKRALSGKGR